MYFFVDFPASRIVLAYDSLTDVEAKSPDRATLVTVRILVAYSFLVSFIRGLLDQVKRSSRHSLDDPIGLGVSRSHLLRPRV